MKKRLVFDMEAMNMIDWSKMDLEEVKEKWRKKKRKRVNDKWRKVEKMRV